MRSSERLLAIVAGALLLAVLGYLIVDRAVLKPARDLDAQAAKLEDEIRQIELENARLPRFKERFQGFAARTFDTDELRVGELARGHLVGLIHRSGLGADELHLDPHMVPSREAGIYKTVSWSVRLRGKLDHVVNFLYLATEDPYLHRLEWQSISPIRKSPEVELRVRYSTLVLGEPKRVPDQREIEFAVNQVADAMNEVRLDGPDRQRYDVIAQRDLFRPYVPKPAPPPSRPSVTRGDDGGRQPPPPPPPPTRSDPAWARMKVVGLPAWGEKQDVILHDETTRRLHRLSPGDDVAGGVIVMVDYRLLPMPDKPEILSGSRVIIRIGQEHWAVELGQRLGEKRILPRSELPGELQAELPPESDATAEAQASAGQGAGEGGEPE